MNASRTNLHKNSISNPSTNSNNDTLLNNGRRSSQSIDQDAFCVSPKIDSKKSNWRKSTISLITPPSNGADKSICGLNFGCGTMDSTHVRKAKLSNLKKTRNSDKQTMPAPIISPLKTETENDQFKSTRNDAPLSNDEALKRLDGLLERIDMLRQLLGRVRNAEYAELVGFEACMLNWEAILKVNF